MQKMSLHNLLELDEFDRHSNEAPERGYPNL